MSISLPTYWNQTQISINNLVDTLTSQQKLIALIAAAALAAVAFGFLVYTCLRRCFKKVEKEDRDQKPLFSLKEGTQENSIPSPLTIETQHEIPSEQSKAPLQTIVDNQPLQEAVKENSTPSPLPMEEKKQNSQATLPEMPKEAVQPTENPSTKIHLTIEERLEKNRKFALEQQLKQSKKLEKYFKIIEGEIPSNLRLSVLTKRNEFQEVDRQLKGVEDLLNGKSIGRALCQGKRLTWEDATLAKLGSFTILNQEYPFELYAVFDGHGGRQAAVFMQTNLLEYLKKAIEKRCQKGLADEGIYYALKECCVNLDTDFNESRVGTTATIALLLEKKLWIANVGDSRAIIVKGEKTIQASEDANIKIPRYKKQIEKLGGKIIRQGWNTLRVNGNLNMARAIGDKVIKSENPIVLEKDKGISPRPKITCYPEDSFDYLLLATDGLLGNGSYRIGTTEEIGEALHHMHLKGDKPVEIAKRLVYTAIMGDILWSSDNVSVLIVKK